MGCDFARTNDIIPDEADKFRSESFNGNLSKIGFILMVVSVFSARSRLVTTKLTGSHVLVPPRSEAPPRS